MKPFRRMLCLLLTLIILASAFACAAELVSVPTTPEQVDLPVYSDETPCPVSEDGEYWKKNDVALYIHLFGHLPDNYITKEKAQALGWEGGSLEPYAPGKSIGGDRFGNYERRLPNGSYRECDIDTRGRPRGAKRLVFTQDGKKIYYTHDHYSTFEEVKP